MRRFKFHSRNRDSGESVTNFVTALRKLAAECEFTDLDDQLRDRIVCGINDAEMQRQMLRETTLNLKKAISIATTTEATERQVSQLVTAQKASRSELDTAKSSERAKNETGIHRTAHSTTYLLHIFGRSCPAVLKARLSKLSMKRFATIEDTGEPIATPSAKR